MSNLHLYRVEVEKTIRLEVIVEATSKEDAAQEAEYSVDWYQIDDTGDIRTRVMCELSDKDAAKFATEDIQNSADGLTVCKWFDHKEADSEANPKPHPNQIPLPGIKVKP
jgi:hypothetical protein